MRQAVLVTVSAMAILLPAMRSGGLHLTVGLLFLLEAGMFIHHAWRTGLLRATPLALYLHFRTVGPSPHRPLGALAMGLSVIALVVIRW